jgi:hypothetical protein
MRARALALLFTLGAAALIGAPGQAARRIKAQAPTTSQAAGLRGPLDATAADGTTTPTSSPSQNFSPLPPGMTNSQPAKPPPSPLMLANNGLSPQAKPLAGAIAAPPKPSPDDCRLSCAQTYYFCLAGEDAPRCPTTWGMCVDSCTDTARTTADAR